MHVVVSFQDRALSDYAKRLESLSQNAPVVLAAALNEAGHEMRAATVAAETAQTGLSLGTMARAQHERDATSASLSFSITSHGGNVRLKFFHPVEGGGGVTATPWNRGVFYQGAFLTSGRPGKRYLVAKLNGQVYERVTSSTRWQEKRPGRTKQFKSAIRQARSGLFIPTEMTKGATLATFEAQSTVVVERIVTRLGSFLP